MSFRMKAISPTARIRRSAHPIGGFYSAPCVTDGVPAAWQAKMVVMENVDDHSLIISNTNINCKYMHPPVHTYVHTILNTHIHACNKINNTTQ